MGASDGHDLLAKRLVGEGRWAVREGAEQDQRADPFGMAMGQGHGDRTGGGHRQQRDRGADRPDEVGELGDVGVKAIVEHRARREPGAGPVVEGEARPGR